MLQRFRGWTAFRRWTVMLQRCKWWAAMLQGCQGWAAMLQRCKVWTAMLQGCQGWASMLRGFKAWTAMLHKFREQAMKGQASTLYQLARGHWASIIQTSIIQQLPALPVISIFMQQHLLPVYQLYIHSSDVSFRFSSCVTYFEPVFKGYIGAQELCVVRGPQSRRKEFENGRGAKCRCETTAEDCAMGPSSFLTSKVRALQNNGRAWSRYESSLHFWL